MTGFELVTSLSGICCITWNKGAQPCHKNGDAAPNMRDFWPKVYQDVVDTGAHNIVVKSYASILQS